MKNRNIFHSEKPSPKDKKIDMRIPKNEQILAKHHFFSICLIQVGPCHSGYQLIKLNALNMCKKIYSQIITKIYLPHNHFKFCKNFASFTTLSILSGLQFQFCQKLLDVNFLFVVNNRQKVKSKPEGEKQLLNISMCQNIENFQLNWSIDSFRLLLYS